jgi:hypothetical protein
MYSEHIVTLDPVDAGEVVSENFSILPDGGFSYSNVSSLYLYDSDGNLNYVIDPRGFEDVEYVTISSHAFLPSLDMFALAVDLRSDDPDDSFRTHFYNRAGDLVAVGQDPTLTNPRNVEFKQILDSDGTIFVNTYHNGIDNGLLSEVALVPASGGSVMVFDYTGRIIDRAVERTATHKVYSRQFLVTARKDDSYLLFNELDGMYFKYDRQTLHHDRFTDSYPLSGGKRTGVGYVLKRSDVTSLKTFMRWSHSFTSNQGVFRLGNDDDLIVCTKSPNTDHPYYDKGAMALSDDVPMYVLRLEKFSFQNGQKRGRTIEVPGGLLLGATETDIRVLSPTDIDNQYEIKIFSAYEL